MAREPMTRLLVLMPPGLVDEIDKHADRTSTTRNEAVRQIVRAGLDALKPVSRRSLSPVDKARLEEMQEIEQMMEAAGAPAEATRKVQMLIANWTEGDDPEPPAPTPKPTVRKNKVRASPAATLLAIIMALAAYLPHRAV